MSTEESRWSKKSKTCQRSYWMIATSNSDICIRPYFCDGLYKIQLHWSSTKNEILDYIKLLSKNLLTVHHCAPNVRSCYLLFGNLIKSANNGILLFRIVAVTWEKNPATKKVLINTTVQYLQLTGRCNKDLVAFKKKTKWDSIVKQLKGATLTFKNLVKFGIVIESIHHSVYDRS